LTLDIPKPPIPRYIVRKRGQKRSLYSDFLLQS
jgi:hypothetical protein